MTLGFAAFVFIFGAYRLRLGLKPKPVDTDENAPKTGMARMSQRTHLFVGAIYILLGVALVATSFGFNPLGGLIGPSTSTPSKDEAPSKGIPIDQVPSPKK